MAESIIGSAKEREGNLTPLEEQYIREEEEGDAEQDLLLEKDIAAQRLWQAFQESATAVAHLFRDCQQRAGLSAWVPFHESASAVTQLYRGSADVCRQCIDSGIRYGHRKRTKDILTWAKKKKRFIKREDLIAFLVDKPEPSMHTELPTTRMEDELSMSTTPNVGGCGCGSVPSPRRRLLCREDLPSPESDVFPQRDINRKRQNSFNFEMGLSGIGTGLGTCNTEFGPLTKRIRF